MCPFHYAPAPESTNGIELSASYGVFLDGTFTDPADGGSIPVLNPATGQTLTRVAIAGETEVDAGVAAARRAFEHVWGPMPPVARARHLLRLATLIRERARELAVIGVWDTGRPIRALRDEDIPRAEALTLYHAGWADKLEWAGLGPDPRPVGVVGVIVPWEDPLATLAETVIPALATGNTVVLKPSETAPLTALRFAQLCQEAGLPPGVLTVLPGQVSTETALAGHPGVDVLSFTGPSEAGRPITRAAASRSGRVVRRIGHRSVAIVYEDAPWDEAVDAIVEGVFCGAGAWCCVGARLLVPEAVAEEAAARIQRRMAALRVGDPLDRNTDVGSLPSPRCAQRLSEVIDETEDQGGRRWTVPAELPPTGFWIAPTLFTEVVEAHRIATAEFAGPVLPVLTFRTPDEAVALANRVSGGVSASVWTEKGARMLWTADRLRAGTVWGNGFCQLDPPGAGSGPGGAAVPGHALADFVREA